MDGPLTNSNRSAFFFFEKQGPGAGIFDLQRLQFVQPIEPVNQRHFYGHGVLADAGKLLLTTESDAQGQGYIGVRDAKTLRYLGDFPSYGARPHDCHLLDGGRVLAVTNGGAAAHDTPAPCVAYIDVATRRLLDRHEMPGQDFNTGHMAPISADSAIVVSAPRLGFGVDREGAVSWCNRKAPTLQVANAPANQSPKLLGEALSVWILKERGLAVVTHPTPGLLTFWRLDDHTFWRALRVDNVRGVAPASDGQTLWLSHGQEGSLSLLDPTADTPTLQPVLKHALLAGSHLLNYPMALAKAL